MSLYSPLRRTFQSPLRNPIISNALRNSLRYASINSAIDRGIRRSQGLGSPQGSLDKRAGRSSRESSPRKFESGRSENRERTFEHRSEGSEGSSFVRRGSFRGLPREHQRSEGPWRLRAQNDHAGGNGQHRRSYEKVDTPRVQRRKEWFAKQLEEEQIASDSFGGYSAASGDHSRKYDRSGDFQDKRHVGRTDREGEGRQMPTKFEDGPPTPNRNHRNTRDAADHSWDMRREDRTGRGREDRRSSPKPEFDVDEFIRTGNFQAMPSKHQRPKGAAKPRENREPDYTDRDFRFAQRSQDEQGSYEPKRGSRSFPNARRDQDPNAARGLSDSIYIQPREVTNNYVQSPNEPPTPRKRRRRTGENYHQVTETSPERLKEQVQVPHAVPYTTSSSEFIYGTTAVEAALRCSRRQLFRLYIYQGAGEYELGPTKVMMRKLALSKNVRVKMAFAQWDRLLDKMSKGRPHNGFVLEASPLPKLPTRALCPVQPEDGHFQIELDQQSVEEADVNGTDHRFAITRIAYQQEQTRQPVLIFLDGIVDPGNVGAIIRSAYYLGIDGVIFGGRHSAPLSPIAIKASAGAAENMPLLFVKNEVNFIQRSKANGWRFYAADTPTPQTVYLDSAELHAPKPAAEPASATTTSETTTTGTTSSETTTTEMTPDEMTPDETATDETTPDETLAELQPGNISIADSPSVILMGNEGSGLSHHIKSHADTSISIPGARGITDPAHVDSLNVSVAASLLMNSFLRVPLGASPVPKRERLWKYK